MTRDERKKLQEELEPRLEVFRKAARKNAMQRPWLKEMRRALGIPAAEMAHRLNGSRAWLYRMEQAEGKGWIGLDILDEIAHAMGCRVVYGIVPYMDEPLDELAEGLKKRPERMTPRVQMRQDKESKKQFRETEEWRRKRIWEDAADRMAAQVRARVLKRAEGFGWSVEEARKAQRAKEAAAGAPDGEESAGAKEFEEKGFAPVPQTAEEMRRQGVGGAEALRSALLERLRR